MFNEGPAEFPSVLLGAETADHLRIVVKGGPAEEIDDVWEANWLSAEVTVRAGAFHGAFEASLRAEEFERFYGELGALYEALSGEAVFETLERWVRVRAVGDGRGHVEAACEVRDDPSFGSKLSFSLAFDQTALPAILRSLGEIVRRFPVRGPKRSGA